MPSPGGDDMVTHWLAQAGRVPLLTAAEAIHLGALVRRWQDWEPSPDEAPAAVRRRGLRARDRMVSANLRLVISVAAKLVSHRAPLADRLQSGTIGLARAVEKFDPARGYAFSTYAYWWIRQQINAGELAEYAIYLSAPAHAAVWGRRNGPLTPASREAALAAASLLSLDSPVPGDRDGSPSTLSDILAAAEPEAGPDFDELEARLARLDPIEQRLIVRHWGLDGPPLTLTQLAALATVPPRSFVSIPRVKAIMAQAMAKMSREVLPLAPTLTPWRPEDCCQLSLTLTTPTAPAPQPPIDGADRLAAG